MRFLTIMLISALSFSCSFNHPKRGGDSALLRHDFLIDSEKNIPFRQTIVNDYCQLLDTLDQGDLASLDFAGAHLCNYATDTLIRDSLFAVYQDYMRRMASNYPENNERVGFLLEHSPTPEALAPLRSALASRGILLK